MENIDVDKVKRALQMASDALEPALADADEHVEPGSQLAAEIAAHKAVNDVLADLQRAQQIDDDDEWRGVTASGRVQADSGTPVVVDHRGGLSIVLDSTQTCATCGDTLPAGKRAVRFNDVDTRYAESPAFTCDALRCFRSFLR